MAQKTKRSNPETMPADGSDWTEIDLNELLATKSPAPVFPVDALSVLSFRQTTAGGKKPASLHSLPKCLRRSCARSIPPCSPR
ncbi:hypothetical protein [Pelagibacterium mangrovi]|uniref:hypothetical protein n=1 Tax=Pelagibacterium mangrovi TaxID=3119828 RepID=UPI002FC65855